MLEYSYKVEVKQLETKIKKLELDLIKRPDNERAKRKLKEARDELSWFQQRIDQGLDPGVRVL